MPSPLLQHALPPAPTLLLQHDPPPVPSSLLQHAPPPAPTSLLMHQQEHQQQHQMQQQEQQQSHEHKLPQHDPPPPPTLLLTRAQHSPSAEIDDGGRDAADITDESGEAAPSLSLPSLTPIKRRASSRLAQTTFPQGDTGVPAASAIAADSSGRTALEGVTPAAAEDVMLLAAAEDSGLSALDEVLFELEACEEESYQLEGAEEEDAEGNLDDVVAQLSRVAIEEKEEEEGRKVAGGAPGGIAGVQFWDADVTSPGVPDRTLSNVFRGGPSHRPDSPGEDGAVSHPVPSHRSDPPGGDDAVAAHRGFGAAGRPPPLVRVDSDDAAAAFSPASSQLLANFSPAAPERTLSALFSGPPGSSSDGRNALSVELDLDPRQELSAAQQAVHAAHNHVGSPATAPQPALPVVTVVQQAQGSLASLFGGGAGDSADDTWEVTEQPDNSWEVMEQASAQHMPQLDNSTMAVFGNDGTVAFGAGAAGVSTGDDDGSSFFGAGAAGVGAAEPWAVSAAAGSVFGTDGAVAFGAGVASISVGHDDGSSIFGAGAAGFGAGADDGSSFFASSPPAAHSGEGLIPAPQPWSSAGVSEDAPQPWAEAAAGPNFPTLGSGTDSHALSSGFSTVDAQEQQWGVEQQQPVLPIVPQGLQGQQWAEGRPPACPAHAPAWEVQQPQQHWEQQQQHAYAETSWQQQQQQLPGSANGAEATEAPQLAPAYAQHYAVDEQQYGTGHDQQYGTAQTQQYDAAQAQQYSTAGYPQQYDVTYQQPSYTGREPQPVLQQQQRQDTVWQPQGNPPLEAACAEDFFDSIVPPEEVQISSVLPSEGVRGAAYGSVDAPSAAFPAVPSVQKQAEEAVLFPGGAFGGGGSGNGNGGYGGTPFCDDDSDFFASTPEPTAPPLPFPAHAVRTSEPCMNNSLNQYPLFHLPYFRPFISHH